MKIVFTLCSNNYLAQAKSLGDSVRKHHPDATFIIGLVDKKHPNIDYSFFDPFQILPFNELGFEVFDDMIERYNIVEFNTAVKPFYFEYLAGGLNDGDHIIYIDPDIVIHQPMNEVNQALAENDFVLTPHKLRPSLQQGPFEKLVLNVGVFNLGFLALKITEQTKLLFKWWQERLKKNCRIAFAEGLFVDQIWANYIPCMFEKVHILKHAGYNVGYWNFDERQLKKKGSRYLVNDKYPLVLFHYSSYDPQKPEVLCKWLSYSFEEREDLVNIYNDYRQLIFDNNYTLFSGIPRGLNFLKNHPHVDKKVDEQEAIEASVEMSIRKKIGYRIRNKTDRMLQILFDLK